MTVAYVAIGVLGVAAFVAIAALAGSGEATLPLKALWFAGVGVVCSGYSVVQLLQPEPRRRTNLTDSVHQE